MPSDHNTCKYNCPRNIEAGCCNVNKTDWILGPILDHQKVLSNLKEDDPSITFDNVFIGYTEGKKLYPRKETWQDSSNYPAMRVTNGICNYYKNGCTIHLQKSETCKQYMCPTLRRVLKL